MGVALKKSRTPIYENMYCNRTGSLQRHTSSNHHLLAFFFMGVHEFMLFKYAIIYIYISQTQMLLHD